MVRRWIALALASYADRDGRRLEARAAEPGKQFTDDAADTLHNKYLPFQVCLQATKKPPGASSGGSVSLRLLGLGVPSLNGYCSTQ